MAADRHIIRRASLEVNAGAVVGPGGAFRLQQEAVGWAQDSLLPGLKEVFASLPAIDAHLILDRLELEIDALDPATWTSEILHKLKTELLALLARKLDAATEALMSPEESFLQKLMFYLDYGVLPWNLSVATPADLAREIEAWATTSKAESLAPGLAVAWRSPSARIRFLQSLPPPRLLPILAPLFGISGTLAEAWSHDAALLESLFLPASTGASLLPRPLWHEILAALSHNPRLFIQGLEEEVVHAYLVRRIEERSLAAYHWAGLPFQSPAFRDSRERILRQPRKARSLDPIPFSPARKEAPNPRDPAPGDEAPVSHAPSAARPAHPILEGIHIANAGLVLVAPFLSMLFERLELSSKEELREPATALALLHFLATGEEGPAEFQIPLAKVLCGWPLEKAISLPMTLASPVKEEAGQLLESVIGHWGVIKNTSVDGLREGFLQRPGKLTRKPTQEWLLQVEQKPYDMLLQQLPWTFQVIRLPWMKHVLHTEWIA